MRERDRDPSGRPQNTRPRDAAGRPLPRGEQGVERAPEDIVLPPAEALREAQQLLDSGYPFHAHEVLEAAWKAAEAPQRDLWQGLAQLAVGLTHLQRRNAKGAVALLRRGAGRIEPYAGRAPERIDVAGLVARATALADHVERSGSTELSGEDVRLVLCEES